MSYGITSEYGKITKAAARKSCIETREDISFYADGLSREYVWNAARTILSLRTVTCDGALIHERIAFRASKG